MRSAHGSPSPQVLNASKIRLLGAVCGLALIALIGAPALGQDPDQPDETLPGFKANRVYQMSGIDNVNIFSGDAGIVVPLSPEYSLGPAVKWSLRAYATTKIWDIERKQNCTWPSDEYSASCGTDENYCKPADSYRLVLGKPDLGVGWTLELGRLQVGGFQGSDSPAAAVYYSPDGGLHRFFGTTDPPSPNPPYYTFDGSHLRLSYVQVEGAGKYVVELPDGTKHVFGASYAAKPYPSNADPLSVLPPPGPDFVIPGQIPFWNIPTSPHPSQTVYELTDIFDRFDTKVLHVTYQTTNAVADPHAVLPTPQVDTITLNPTGSSTSIRFYYEARLLTSPDLATTFTYYTLNHIDLPAFGGGTSRVDFVFQNRGVNRQRNGWTDPEHKYACLVDQKIPVNVTLPLLNTITLGSTKPNDPAALNYLFEYTESTLANDLLDAVISKVTLPTGGEISYTIGKPVDYFNNADTTNSVNTCDNISTHAPPEWNPHHGPTQTIATPQDPIEYIVNDSPAVTSRKVFDPVANTSATTTYKRYVCSDFYSDCHDGCIYRPSPTSTVRAVLVTEPNGNGTDATTKHIFHFDLGKAADVYSSGIELERRYYEDDTAAGAPVRSVVNCYQGETTYVGAGEPGYLAGAATRSACGYWNPSAAQAHQQVDYPFSKNIRQYREMTVYGPNTQGITGCTPIWAGDVPESTYPCAESYRTGYQPGTTSAGEFSSEKKVANDTGLLLLPTGRTTTTQWNPSISTTNTSLSDLRWLLKLYLSRTVQDVAQSGAPPCVAPCSRKVDADFNTGNGFLNSYQVSDPDSTESNYGSLTHAYTPASDGSWNPATERISGTLLAGSYSKERNFQNGLVTKDWWDNLSPTWKNFDVERDAGTGLIKTSSDPNPSLKTTFQYDLLGRLTSVTPPGNASTPGTPTGYCYSGYASSTGTPAYVIASEGSSNCSGNDATGKLEAYEYDGFGRVLREIERQPGSAGNFLAYRQSIYDGMGRKTFESEWTECGTTSVTGCFGSATTIGTTWSNFDPFGRPRSILKADLTTITVDRSDGPYCVGVPAPCDAAHTGDGTDKEKSIIYTDTTEAVTTSNVAGGSARTWKRKDLLGRLALVSNPYDPATTTLVGADGLAMKYNVLDKVGSVSDFADSRQAPRAFAYDVFGFLRSEFHPEKGTTTYSSYDPLGDALAKQESNGGTPISYASIYDAAGRLSSLSVGTTPYFQNTYDQATVSSQYPLGRLARRIGSNPMSSPPGTVTEDFGYSGPAGQLTYKKMTFSSPATSTQQGWTFDGLGRVTTYSHPRVSGTFQALVESYAYSSGKVTGITANESSLTGESSMTPLATGDEPILTSVAYDPSGGLASYSSGNGATTTIVRDPTGISRPQQIFTTLSNGAVPFDTGLYGYDGLGNITNIDAAYYRYDARSRLISYEDNSPGNRFLTRNCANSLNIYVNHIECFGYDTFGNLNSWTRDGSGLSPDPDPATNRLKTGTAIQYDGLGNLTKHGLGTTYTYDALSRQTAYADTNTSTDAQYLYSGDGERVVQFGATVAPLSLTVSPIPPLTGAIGYSFSATFTASGGTGAYVFSISGSLPAGLTSSVNSDRLSITGAPTSSGLYTITVSVSDAYSTQQQTVAINIDGSYFFYTIAPCRLVDTRTGAPAVYSGGGAVANNGRRDFVATGACGIPSNARALAINLTSTGDTTATGFLRTFPTGLPTQPNVNSVDVRTGKARAGRIDVELNAATGKFSVGASLTTGTSANAVVDVFGYFARAGGLYEPPPADLAPSPRGFAQIRPLTAGGMATLTLRDGQNHLSTEMSQPYPGGGVYVSKDYFYLGSLQVATLQRLKDFSGFKFYASDHLGTPRLEMDAANGYTLFKYWPYGEKMTADGSTSRLGFAAMELDLGSNNHFDHARFYRGQVGRFNSPDELGGNVEDAQSWNRYSYAHDNPLLYLDPDGQAAAISFVIATQFGDPTAVKAAQFLAGTTAGANVAAKSAAFTAVAGPPLIAGAMYAPGLVMTMVDIDKAITVGTAAVELAAGAAGVSTSGAALDNAIASLSKNSAKHIMEHVGEFQSLDSGLGFRDVVKMGLDISSKMENLVGTPGGRKVFEKVVVVGGQSVTVKVVLNTNGMLRSVFVKLREKPN